MTAAIPSPPSSIAGSEQEAESGATIVPGFSFSAQPWVDRLLRELLRRALPEILGELEGRGLSAIILSGSASLGEAVGWEDEAGRRHLLSDLDLGAVCERPPDPALCARLQCSLGGERVLGDLPEAGGGALTIGFYSTRYLDRQVPTPGLVDLRSRGRVLWGDPRILDRFRAPECSRIPIWEGVRLAGNRALELLAAEGETDGEWWTRARSLHALAKAITGLWTAHLVLQGRYRTGWSARQELLEQAAAGEGPTEIIGQARRWSRFLVRPAPASLPECATGEEGALEDYRSALAEWLAALPERLLLPGELRESVFLREPMSVRERLRAWKRGSGDKRVLLRSWARGELLGTPDGRRMAMAALYWRLLPERPEPAWGSSAPLMADERVEQEWRLGAGKWLGRVIPAGAGCRGRVRTALGLGGEELI